MEQSELERIAGEVLGEATKKLDAVTTGQKRKFVEDSILVAIQSYASQRISLDFAAQQIAILTKMRSDALICEMWEKEAAKWGASKR